MRERVSEYRGDGGKWWGRAPSLRLRKLGSGSTNQPTYHSNQTIKVFNVFNVWARGIRRNRIDLLQPRRGERDGKERECDWCYSSSVRESIMSSGDDEERWVRGSRGSHGSVSTTL